MGTKAKSRLGEKTKPTLRIVAKEITTLAESQLRPLERWKITFVPWLGGSFFCFFLTYLLMINVPPAVIANFPVPDVYLPLQLLVAAGCFLGATFLWQNRWRGLITMFFASGLLFLKLQKIQITPLVVLMWLLMCGVALSLSFVKLKKAREKFRAPC